MSDLAPNNNITDEPQPLQAAPYTPPTSTENEQGVFKGRLNRLGYLMASIYWTLVTFIPLVLCLICVGISNANPGSPANILASLFVILTLLVALAVSVLSVGFSIRRLHDFNQSGLLALLLLVPGANYIFVIVLLFIPGTPGPNRYGSGPQQTLGFKDVSGFEK